MGRSKVNHSLSSQMFAWAVDVLCQVNRVPFQAELLLRAFPPPYTLTSLQHALKSLGFHASLKKITLNKIPSMALPCLALCEAQQPVAIQNENRNGANVDAESTVIPEHTFALIIKVPLSNPKWVMLHSEQPIRHDCTFIL